MKKGLMAAAVAIVLPVAANAQEFTPFPGYYAVLGGGPTFPLNASNVANTGYGIAGRVGYDFLGPRIDLEVDYNFIPLNIVIPGTVLNYGVRQIQAMVNGYYDFFPASTISPYVGAGAGVAFIDSNTAFGSTQFAYQAIIGVVWHWSNNWAVGIETKFAGTTNPSFSSGGRTFTYSNNAITAHVGVAYKFGCQQCVAAAPVVQQQVPTTPSFIVFFDWDRSNLSEQALNTIRQAAGYYKTRGTARVTTTGHADKSGPEAYNMALSLRRANTVKDALVREGVPATAIAVVGRGEAMPLVQTADGVREPQNRRVEIVIQ